MGLGAISIGGFGGIDCWDIFIHLCNLHVRL
jgi:hypothetical protein